MASITVRFVAGRNTLASLLCMPQSRAPAPLRGLTCGFARTCDWNRAPLVSSSLSAIGSLPPELAPARLAGDCVLGTCRPPERAEQAVVAHGEHPLIHLLPDGVPLVINRDRCGVRKISTGTGSQVGLKFGQSAVDPRPDPGADGRAQRAAFGHPRDMYGRAEDVGHDLRPERTFGRAAGEDELGEAAAGQLGDDLPVAAGDERGRLLDRADAGGPP